MTEFLSKDELRRLYVGATQENTDLFIERNALRAEVAALREDLKKAQGLHAVVVKDRQRIREKYLGELAEARALLAAFLVPPPGQPTAFTRIKTEAFLRRDEG